MRLLAPLLTPKATKRMSFKQDVKSSPGLNAAWKPGIKALTGSHREQIDASGSRLLGSADIDAALLKTHPDASRWDYVVGCGYGSEERKHFIEFHPASGMSDIRVVELKSAWLLQWIKNTPLNAGRRSLHWVATGSVCFTQTNPKIRALAQKGVAFRGSRLDLNES